jgi:hypothetical protein
MSGRQAHKYPSGERTPGSVLANSGPPGVPGMPFRVVVACIVMVEDRIDVVESMIDFRVLGPQDAGNCRGVSENAWQTANLPTADPNLASGQEPASLS